MKLEDRVVACIETRQIAAELIGQLLKDFKVGSEIKLRDIIQDTLASQRDILEDGWYSPPPAGIGVLFGLSNDTNRTRFPSFRQESYWPSSKYILEKETVGTVYVSPVHSNGAIGDLGFSFYRGIDKNTRDHLKNCLEAIEDVADHASVGLQFRELYQFAQKRFAERNITHKWITTNLNISGNSIGHTVPWSYELPTADEYKIIKAGQMDELKDVISHKRLYLDADETFVIPGTVAFTVESQLGSRLDSNLPNTFFHTIVTFNNGKKQVLANFNSIFDKLKIDYMRSRF